MIKKNPDAIAICLNCYKIKFNEKGKAVSRTVDRVFGRKDLIPIMNDFIKNIDAKKVFKNKKDDRILYLRESLKASKSENIYAGVLMKGHNGTQTAIDELIKNEIKNVGVVSKDQFHCLPYFFLIYLNSSKPNEFIFIAQSYRQYGFKEIFEEAFKTFTATMSEDTTVHFNSLSIASLYEKYIEEGRINKIRFIKHGLQKGADQVLAGDNTDDKNYEMELSIKSKNGFMGIKQHLKYDNASFIEQVQIDGYEFNDVYADVIVAGRKRVLNVSKPKDFCAAYDITHEVFIDPKTNLPDFKDILDQSIDILNNDLIPYL